MSGKSEIIYEDVFPPPSCNSAWFLVDINSFFAYRYRVSDLKITRIKVEEINGTNDLEDIYEL